LAYSTCDLLEIAEQLRDAGARMLALGEPRADTTAAAKSIVLTVFAGNAGIAEVERALIQHRTSPGSVAAMKRGIRFKRLSKLILE